MKKRLYLLIPVAVLLLFGLFMVPAKAAMVTDGQNDVIGIKSWTEDGNPKLDCDWVPTDVSMIDINTITWLDAGANYTVTMTFYGTPNATLIADGDVMATLFFLINGTQFPDDVETETPEAHLMITTTAGGTVLGNATSIPEVGVMTVSGNDIVWNFNKSIEPVTPDALENWDLMAFAGYSYTENISNVIYSNTALDHYNFDYLEEALTAICALLNLQIPGYSLIAMGAVAIITIGVIIKKKFKK